MSSGWIHCPDKNGNKEELRKYLRALFSGSYGKNKAVSEENDTSNEMAEYWVEYTPLLMDWLHSLDPAIKAQTFKGSAQYVNFPGASTSSYAHCHLMYPDRASRKSSYKVPTEQTVGGEALWRALEKGLNDRKEHITIYGSTPAVSLITNEQGDVIGVEATKDGKPYKIEAKKGVVLASGGYEYGKELRKAFLPGPAASCFAFFGTPYNEGDGIKMGIKVGAGLSKVSSVAGMMIWAPPVYHNGMRLGTMTVGIGAPGTFVVNSLGKRFVAENKLVSGIPHYSIYEKAAEQNYDTLTYDNMPAWLIFDEKLLKSRPLAELSHSTAGYEFIDYGAPDNSDALKKGWILQADSVEELAKKIGESSENGGKMNAEALKDSLQKFNAYAAAGNDDEFGRNPKTLKALEPGKIYAIPLFAGGPATKGGLKTNGSHQVLTWEGKPIKGLYAAGEVACGFNRGGGTLTEA